MREQAQEEYERVSMHLERSRWTLERQRLLASLPDDRRLAKVQRYEAYLSRQFYRTLHELQRLQAARQGSPVAPPTAIDVDMAFTKSNRTG